MSDLEQKKIPFDSNPDKPYSPEIQKEKTYQLKEADYNSKLDNIADKNGFIKTRLNEEVIINRISHDLYKNPESALRELYNNELRACQIAKAKFKTDPYIKVSLDTFEKKLIIQGFNSLGITEDIFCKILVELGTSSNHDRKTIGQFGMGFASYTKLSDLMIVETKCIENKDQYSVIAKNGLGFEKLPKPNLDKTGTKLSLTLRENKEQEPDYNFYTDLINMLESLTKYSDIKTYLEIKTDIDLNYKSGIHELKQTTLKDQFESYVKEQKEDPDHDRSIIDYSFEDSNIEIYVCFSASKGNDYYYHKDKVETYLLNTPIEIDLDYVSDYDYLLVNLKDEKIFKPMGDRERLTKEAETKLEKILKAKLKEAFKVASCHTLEAWNNHDHKWFISSTSDQIIESLDPETKKLNEFLNIKVSSKEKPKDSHNRNRKFALKNLLSDYDLSAFDNFFYIDKRDKRKFDTLDIWFKDKNYFMCVMNPKYYNEHDDLNNYDYIISLVKKFGFKSTKDYIKQNKIKLAELVRSDPDHTSIDNEITLYYSYEDRSNYYNKKIKVDTKTFFSKDDLDTFDFNKIIMIKGINKYRSILKEFNTNELDNEEDRYYLTPEKKHTKDLSFTTIKDLEKTLSNKIFCSNYGYKSLDKLKKIIDHKIKTKIKEHPKTDINFEISFIEINKPIPNTLLKYLEFGNNDLYILGNKLDLFLMALVFNTLELSKKPLTQLIIDYISSNNQNYYNNSMRVAVEKTTKKFKKQIKNKDIIDYDVLDEIDNNFDKTIEYFNALLEIDSRIKDPALKKLFTLSHDVDNYKAISKDVLRLQSDLN